MIPPERVPVPAAQRSPEEWSRVRMLVEASLVLSAERRATYLDSACGNDVALRAEVESLIVACERAAGTDGFLEDNLFLAAPAPVTATPSDGVEDALRAALAGRYEIVREAGRGGMARVFLARDLRHGRRVALKVLQPELRVLVGGERFLAEIGVTARLQHPNILPLFDSGEVDGFLYYVMPFVEGENLRQRLEAEGQLPIDEALRLTIATAGALDYAHRQGIVHRDLKPENVLLHDGQPLVADFGIALALSVAGGDRLTQTGLSLGTPTYMSPEQASAERVVDARSDVYALACVLYEMLTGEPPHTARSVQQLIAKIMAETPRGVRALRATVPLAVEQVIDRALSKLPADRFPTARAFADALEAAGPASAQAPGAAVAGRLTTRRRLRDPLLVGATVIAFAAVGLAAWALSARPAGDAMHTTRFSLGELVTTPVGGSPAITPDGRHVVYAGSPDAGRPLMIRALDELEARPIPGTRDAVSATVSPDGRWVAYFTMDDKLRKVPIGGGTPALLAGAFRYNRARWTVKGIVTDASSSRGLTLLPETGGAVRQLTATDGARGERRHYAPLMLPDGETIVFIVERNRAGPTPVTGELAVATLDVDANGPGRHRPLGLPGGLPVGFVDGWLLYVSDDASSMLAVRFDIRRGEVRGSPMTVLREKEAGIFGAALAADGTLLYSVGRGAAAPMLVGVDGSSRNLLARPGSGPYMNPRFSRDGRRIVLQAGSPQGNDVWVYAVETGTSTRLTQNGASYLPVWTPDARRVVYHSNQDGNDAMWWQAADGSAPPEKLFDTENSFAANVTPDGRTVLFQRQVGTTWEIWSAPLARNSTARPLLKDRFDQTLPAVSPDGRWLAYVSNASGLPEVYVRSYPALGAPVLVSVGGGTEPAWARDGRTLYYRSGRQLVGADLAFTPSPVVRRRSPVFADVFQADMPHTNYDVAPDGSHFAMIGAPAALTETIVAVNWVAELRARLAGQ